MNTKFRLLTVSSLPAAASTLERIVLSPSPATGSVTPLVVMPWYALNQSLVTLDCVGYAAALHQSLS